MAFVGATRFFTLSPERLKRLSVTAEEPGEHAHPMMVCRSPVAILRNSEHRRRQAFLTRTAGRCNITTSVEMKR